MYNLAKRLFDIVSGAAALIVLSPVLLMAALWIKFDSQGPVLFLQQRAGLNGHPFRIVKFRTMIHRTSDEIDQHAERVVCARRDPRITRAGCFIRAMSLDELPQFINILKGEMSVVGPRPVLMEQKDLVPPGYMKRFSVRPGLTGLAQVRGRRGLGWLQQLALDAEYVEKHSVFFDIGIILQTVKVVLLGRGIYGGEELNWRSYRDSLDGRAPSDDDVTAALAGHEPGPEKAQEGQS